MNRIVNLYKTLYIDAEETSLEERQAFWNTYDQGNLSKRSKTLNLYNKDRLFIEKELLFLIEKTMNLERNTEYLNLFIGDNMASAKKSNNGQVVLFDQLLTEDLIMFLILVFMAADVGKIAKAAPILQKKTMEINKEELLLGLDESILNLSMDAYWCAWTFIIGHELFHLNVNEPMGFKEEEYEADKHGYETLMKMILAQKNGDIPYHLRVYTEDLYLAPIMCMKYFAWKDYPFPDWFSPEQRIEHIFDLFADLVPDEIDTEQGNELLNLFLDAYENATTY